MCVSKQAGFQYTGEQKLLERIFASDAQPPEQLIRQLCGQDGASFRFGAAGLYGRFPEKPGREALFEAFDEIFYYLTLPEVTLLLLRPGADHRRTTERTAVWLRDRGVVMNAAYLTGEHGLSEARQIRETFEAAAGEIFFHEGKECLSLDTPAPTRHGRVLTEEELRRLRRIRQELSVCLIRDEAAGVRKKLEEYFDTSALGSPTSFREQCAKLYFHLSEEEAAVYERQESRRNAPQVTEKPIFQLIEEANRAKEIKDCLSGIVERLLSTCRPVWKDTENRVVMIVEKYIKNHYMDSIAIEDIAAKVGLSANYVRSIFKSSQGQSIQGYLSEYRLEMACRFLRSTPTSVSKVAQLVGYNNVSYFCASFQKRYGKTPSEWRRGL